MARTCPSSASAAASAMPRPGLRLRYEIKEAFAPYVGLSWSRDLGRTARLTREEGEDPETKSLVMGVRSAF